MKKTKLKIAFMRRGEKVKVYHDSVYSHSMSVTDMIKLSNTMRDAARATGPVSTVITTFDEDTQPAEAKP